MLRPQVMRTVWVGLLAVVQGSQWVSRSWQAQRPSVFVYTGREHVAILPDQVDTGVVDRLGESLGNWYKKRVAEEVNFHYSAPMIDVDSDVAIINGSLVLLQLGTRIAESRFTTIMAVANRTDIVVKYQLHYTRGRDIHPLMRDFFFLDLLRDLKIAPTPHFLSPATRPEPTLASSPKIRSLGQRGHSAVRFMVMDRVTASINDLIHQGVVMTLPPAFEDVMSMLEDAIDAMKLMHDRGVIHGDVHSGNVAVLGGNKRRVGFIDFGLGFHIDETRYQPALLYPPFTAAECFHTHWNVHGYRPSFRDDMLRLLMVGGHMLNGPRWLNHCRSLAVNPQVALMHKSAGNLFGVPGSPALADVHVSKRGTVERHLKTALSLSRGVDGLDDRPPYENIKSALRSASRLVEAELCISCSSM